MFDCTSAIMAVIGNNSPLNAILVSIVSMQKSFHGKNEPFCLCITNQSLNQDTNRRADSGASPKTGLFAYISYKLSGFSSHNHIYESGKQHIEQRK